MPVGKQSRVWSRQVQQSIVTPGQVSHSRTGGTVFSGGTGSSFMPNDIAGLIWALDARQSGAVGPNHPVTLWPDLSPFGFDAKVVTNAPTFVPGALNGNPVVRFSGASNQYLQTDVNLDLTLLGSPNAAFTAFVVQQCTLQTSFFTAIALIKDMLLMSDENDAPHSWGILGGGNSGIALGDSQARILSYRASGFTSAKTETHTNGVLNVSATGYSHQNKPVTQIAANQAAQFYTGDIGVWYLYNRFLTDAEYAVVLSALSSRFRISLP